MKKGMLLAVLAFGLGFVLGGSTEALGAYSAHQNDKDVNNFLAVYPFAKGTKLDDCALCHPGGKASDGKTYGSCDYCHIEYGLTSPHAKSVPLNAYGSDYKAASRSQQALIDIEGKNSDNDSHTNGEEIRALFFPGDEKDYPGLVPSHTVVMNLERILELPSHSQFLLANASKQRDAYIRYTGVKVKGLLKAVGIRPEATTITVFAPDGFSKSFPIDAADPQTPGSIQYDVDGPYPKGFYYGGLDFVDYTYDPGYPYEDGFEIPDKLYLLLGYLRDGDPLKKGRLIRDPSNSERLVLDGEGPYRLIVPQKIAGSPDRGSNDPQKGDGLDYDSKKDHNWGAAVRSLAAIRVEPLLDGTTDFRWQEGGWNLVDNARLVIYGAIDPCTVRVTGKVEKDNGDPIADVRLSIGLVSLGQVKEVTTGKKGRFHVDLPAGEYVIIPSKEGYQFSPESISVQLSEKGRTLEFTGIQVQ
jgi:hypothetical protein